MVSYWSQFKPAGADLASGQKPCLSNLLPTAKGLGSWVLGFCSSVIKIINHKPRTMSAHYSAHYSAGVVV